VVSFATLAILCGKSLASFQKRAARGATITAVKYPNPWPPSCSVSRPRRLRASTTAAAIGSHRHRRRLSGVRTTARAATGVLSPLPLPSTVGTIINAVALPRSPTLLWRTWPRSHINNKTPSTTTTTTIIKSQTTPVPITTNPIIITTHKAPPPTCLISPKAKSTR